MPPLGFKYPPGFAPQGAKKGPRKFPGSRRKRCDLRVPPVAPFKRPKMTYPKKYKADVLRWLINTRVPDNRWTNAGSPVVAIYYASRTKKGLGRPDEAALQEVKRKMLSGEQVYRPPTYLEAEKYWKIPVSTLTYWWSKKAKYLPPEELENVKDMVFQPDTIFAIPTHSSPQSSSQNPTSENSPSTDATRGPTETAAMAISSDSDSESVDTDDGTMSDLDTAIGVGDTQNKENANEDQEIQNAQESQPQVVNEVEEEEGEEDDTDEFEDLEAEVEAGQAVDEDWKDDDDAEGEEDTRGLEDSEMYGLEALQTA